MRVGDHDSATCPAAHLLSAAGFADRLERMADPSAVVVASAAAVTTLKVLPGVGKQIIVFADTDVLRAGEAIATHKPNIIVFQREFLDTPRGAARRSSRRSKPTPTCPTPRSASCPTPPRTSISCRDARKQDSIRPRRYPVSPSRRTTTAFVWRAASRCVRASRCDWTDTRPRSSICHAPVPRCSCRSRCASIR